MGQTVLVLGGVRSGKSRLAERLAAEGAPVTYLATAQFDRTDPEMVARIGRHRAERPEGWVTREVPRDLEDALATLTDGGGTVLIDCVTLWLSNLMAGAVGVPALEDGAILEALGRASGQAKAGKARVVWVSNEVGSGGVPAHPLARRFADLQGGANQRLAADCDAVHLCVAGLPIRLK